MSFFKPFDSSAIEAQITAINNNIVIIQGDITTIQGDITTIQGDIVSLDARVTALENAITNLGKFDANGEYAGAGNFNVTAFAETDTALLIDFDNNGAVPFRINTDYSRTGFARPGTMANFTTFSRLDSNRIFGSGNGAVPYYSDNDGATWTAVTGLVSGGQYYAASNGSGVAVAAQQGSSNVYRSTNNGATWALDTSAFGVNSQGVRNCRYNSTVGQFIICKIGNIITSATGTGWANQSYPAPYTGTFGDLTQAACCEYFNGNYYVTDMDSNRVMFGATLATLGNLDYPLAPANAYNITFRGCRVLQLHNGDLVWANDTTTLITLDTAGVANLIAASQFDTNISAFDVIASFNGEIWRPIKQVIYRNLRAN